ncbi:H(+)/Cl(-) exchange transporter ClcA [Symmachiella dynata]|uniref:chloride channel protein n=1 Tax=Symmachiella dynata TaxID=2527995 RepID=UPI001189B5D3|nr:chloride channel protein [Symmachiella dynata]QDT46864.1 H(+)/Cl(-) exchange transporter ClcA [Symmachiella dynata]
MTNLVDSTTPKPLSIWIMALLAVAVGLIGGFGAVIFRGMIAIVHNLLFLGTFSYQYDANIHTPTPSPWGAWIILVPVLGAVGVAFLVKTFAPEAKGHGVPEVMDAVYYGKGAIRPVVAAVKSCASALSIGSGGSVGREGPIIQIGAAFGSSLGQLIPMPTHQRVTLIAAGGGAGIAATFNTPIGGGLFAMELMMTSIRAKSVLPVFIATAVATWIGREFLGMNPAFDVPTIQHPSGHPLFWAMFPLLVVFGIVIGLASALFVRSIYWTEDLFDKMPGNYYTRHMLGMLTVGVIMWLLMNQAGHYYVQGVGYATVQDVLQNTLEAPGFLLLLVALKLVATNLTLGSGASGGVFSPSLFIGACLGGCLGTIVRWIDPGFPVEPSIFAVAGMAGMIGGTTGAVATGSIMMFEMTRDLDAVVPILLTVGIAWTVRKRISSPSIYTLKLLRRGHNVPEGLMSDMPAALTAKQAMTTEFSTTTANDDTVPTEAAPNETFVIQCEGNTVRGVQPGKSCVFVEESSSLTNVLADLDDTGADVALVFRDGSEHAADDVVGVITHDLIARTLGRSATLYR